MYITQVLQKLLATYQNIPNSANTGASLMPRTAAAKSDIFNFQNKIFSTCKKYDSVGSRLT